MGGVLSFMYTTIQQGRIWLNKSDSKDFYIVTKEFYFILCNAVLLNFLFIKESWEKEKKNILSSKTVFNIDNNNKCFLSTKAAY